jgi:hypothetical protein
MYEKNLLFWKEKVHKFLRKVSSGNFWAYKRSSRIFLYEELELHRPLSTVSALKSERLWQAGHLPLTGNNILARKRLRKRAKKTEK